MEIYVKNDSALLVASRFVYEVTINCYYENYYFMVNSAMFESDVFIENLVESHFLNKHIQISSELYAAPKEFIDKEEYKLEVKTPRKSKKK